jgi:hypothetical protein
MQFKFRMSSRCQLHDRRCRSQCGGGQETRNPYIGPALPELRLHCVTAGDKPTKKLPFRKACVCVRACVNCATCDYSF